MDAETKHPCNCELCSQNWHLGDGGDQFVGGQCDEAPPDLAWQHAAKVARATTEFAPLREVALN